MLGLLMNRWVLGGLAGLVMLGFSYWKGYTHGKETVQQKWDAANVQMQAEIQKMASEAMQAERSMQKEVNRIQKEKHDAVKAANSKYSALVDSLRNRPETRATDTMPSSTGDVVGCTGAQLARPDAEFLAGYAADAERLQAAYNSCRQAYEVIQHGAQ